MVALLAVGGFASMKGAGTAASSAKASAADPAPASGATQPSAAASTSADAGGRTTLAVQATNAASAPVRAWHTSAQPAVVAAIRNESLAAYQVQVERWACEAEQCVGDLQVPPTVEAGRTGNMQAASDIFNKLKEEMAKSDVDVALRSIKRGPQGLAVAVEFTPVSARKGRFYTDAEITAIRAESFDQGMKAANQVSVH